MGKEMLLKWAREEYARVIHLSEDTIRYRMLSGTLGLFQCCTIGYYTEPLKVFAEQSRKRGKQMLTRAYTRAYVFTANLPEAHKNENKKCCWRLFVSVCARLIITGEPGVIVRL